LAALAALEEIRRMGHTDEGLRRAPELFRNTAALISRAYDEQPLVLIIDEFDRVVDKRGFAGMIKNDRFVTFIIVGTAVDVRPLIQEHASVQRQLAGGQVRVHPLKPAEVNAILRVEETRAAGAFKFGPSAVASIVNSSRGFPFYVHLFGRYALRHALANQTADQCCPLEIGRDHVVGGMHEALRDQQDLHDRYLDVVRGKWEREAMLKLFACRDEDDVPVANVYPHAEKLSIPNYKRQTESMTRSAVLIATGQNHYMFTDARLKVYARLVEPICEPTRRVLDHLSSRLLDPRAEGWMFDSQL
jgi:hypothetical protein